VKRILKKMKLGPATLVAAAFIGPGTVTMCTLAGAKFGYELLWAMIFSIVATIVIQEMSARTGMVSRMGLGEALRSHLPNPFLKIIALFLVLSAILIGNAAYEAGNLAGAALGAYFLLDLDTEMAAIILGFLAAGLLYIGNIRVIEKILVALVVLMSISFLITAIATKPPFIPLIKGMLIPKINWDNLLFVTALVGTTVVPYNLFLHASLAKEKWKVEEMSSMRWDTVVSIFLGGIVSMSIIIAAAAIGNGEITDVTQLSKSLTPLLGEYAGILIAIGLLAAGLTSAITAPLAAAYATSGILGWNVEMKSFRFRAVWLTIIAIGILFSTLKIRPIEIIQFAQVTNGILLPLIVCFLFYLVNQKSLMKEYKNNKWQNLMSLLIILLCIGLSIRTLIKVMG
jgi:NRAMP (natural resistance-associated macrophage protein)-like metal ion transporter